MNNFNIFSFSTRSIQNVAFAMARGKWAVPYSPDDKTNKSRSTKAARNMQVGDYVVFVGTKDSGYQGILALGQVTVPPVVDTNENGQPYGKVIADPLWGAEDWFLEFSFNPLTNLDLEKVINRELLRSEIGLGLNGLASKGTQNFVPSQITGDQFLQILSRFTK